MTAATPLVDEARARELLTAHDRIAVVGASPASGNFGAAIARELHRRGTGVVTVHPDALPVDDLPSYRSLVDVPGSIDAAIVVVPAAAAAEVVRACAARGVERVWLFKGIGGAGSVSAEAIAEAERLGIEAIPGACPLMFLEPVAWFHRVHRSVRRRRHALAPPT